MRTPEVAILKIEKIEGKLKTMSVLLTRQSTAQQFQEQITSAEELLQDVKDMVQRNIQ
jgi:hypothetical protein